MKIVTLTLNPAFDVHCFAEKFRPYHETVAQITSTEAGGKGVNISRALTFNGRDNLAVVIVGKENGAEFCKILEKDGLTIVPVWTEGRIRENITLHEKTEPETRISFNGFTCERGILTQVREKLGTVDENTIVAFAGSIPKCIESADVLSLLSVFKKQGAKIVVDSRSLTLDELLSFKPWLIKPNKDEAESYTGETIDSVETAASIARKLHGFGIENVMISLGDDGAVLACEQGAFHATPPKIDAISTIGAGDSTIAGFIDGHLNGLNAENALKRATAYGTAACLRVGTQPPLPCDVKEIENGSQIRKLA